MAEAPEKVRPEGLADYLDVMSRVVMQTGMSWQVVAKKWPGVREAFHGFDPVRVAGMDGGTISTLMTDSRVVRNRRKLEAIVDNARTLLELDVQYGSFGEYLRSHGDFEATAKDLRKRFRFMGDLGAYYFLYVVDEPVPTYDEWCASRGRTHVQASS